MGCSNSKSSLTNSTISEINNPKKLENKKEDSHQISEQNFQDIKKSIIS